MKKNLNYLKKSYNIFYTSEKIIKKLNIMQKISTHFSIILLLCFFTACFPSKRYNYNNIMKQYSTNMCELKTNNFNKNLKIECDLSKPFSLSSAIKLALKNNPDTKLAIYKIKEAQAELKKAKTNFFPDIVLYFEYVQGETPSASLFKGIDQRKLPETFNFNYPGWFQNYESGINARLNLYNGSRDILNIKAAEKSLKYEDLNKKFVENNLIFSTISAYYDLLAAMDYVQIAKESKSTVEAQYKIMDVRYKAGGALKSDILSLQVRCAKVEEELLTSQNQLKTSKAILGNILGIGPENIISIDKITDFTDFQIPESYTACVAVALKKRPEIEKNIENIKKARIYLDIALSTYLPTLDFFTKAYHDDEKMKYRHGRGNWTVAALMNLNLSSAIKTPPEVQKAKAILMQAITFNEKTILSVKLDVKKALLLFEEACARYKVAEATVANAIESFNLVKKQYEGGSANITRYLEAELDRNRSRIRKTAAFYDKQKSLAYASKALGDLNNYINK